MLLKGSVGVIVYYLMIGLVFMRLQLNVYKEQCTMNIEGVERPIEQT